MSYVTLGVRSSKIMMVH